MQNYRRFSAWMARLTATLALLYPLVSVLLWFVPGGLDMILEGLPDVRGAVGRVGGPGLLAGIAVTAAHASLVALALWVSSHLFSQVSKGDYFSPHTGKRLRLMGGTLLAYAVASPFVDAALSVALTVNNPPGQRLLAISISSHDINMVVFGALFLVLGHVLAEAARMADDHSQIV